VNIDHLEVLIGSSVEMAPWGWIRHLRVRRYDGLAGISWDELQAVKNYYLGPDAQAIEIYPRAYEVVDEVNMRHLWEVPLHLQIPNLAR